MDSPPLSLPPLIAKTHRTERRGLHDARLLRAQFGDGGAQAFALQEEREVRRVAERVRGGCTEGRRHRGRENTSSEEES